MRKYLNSKDLGRLFRKYEKRLDNEGPRWWVEPGRTRDHLNDIVYLDTAKKGFLKPNQYGEDLRKLWETNPDGFYVVYDRTKPDASHPQGLPVGYCDFFVLDPEEKFIEYELIKSKVFSLPSPTTLAKYSTIPMNKWKNNTVDVFVDALLVLDHERNFGASYALLRKMGRDFQKMPGIRVSKMATVAVQNSHEDNWSPEIADKRKQLRCPGAQLALRFGWRWGKYNQVDYETDNKDKLKRKLGRFLYAMDYSDIGLYFAVTMGLANGINIALKGCEQVQTVTDVFDWLYPLWKRGWP